MAQTVFPAFLAILYVLNPNFAAFKGTLPLLDDNIPSPVPLLWTTWEFILFYFILFYFFL